MSSAATAPLDAPVTTPALHTSLVYAAPLSDLQPSPLNPRKHFGDLDELAANIAARGIIVPLIVRERQPTAKGGSRAPYLEIVDGERRYRAGQHAGVQFVPVIRRDELSDAEVLELQLVSAIQRADLTPLEEARGYQALIASAPAKYSAAYIADRISRSERYVVDRMRLLDLTPALQRLLEQDRIGVAHAELIAKLTPEDQVRVSHPGDADTYGRSGDPGGLWQRTDATLDFDTDDEAEEGAALAKDPYAGLKPRTIKELEAWIARHVRFNVQHFATTAPLEFGDTAAAVELAQAKPGRGKKVIAITADYRIEDDVKGDERVYGKQAWRRADGTAGTSTTERGKPADSPTCEHSVLGVFTAGPGYGTALQVCIARDRCQTHFATEIRAREKNAALRASGKSKTAARNEAKERESYEAQQAREEAERRRFTAIYSAMHPALVAALKQAVPSTLTPAICGWIWARVHHGQAPKVPAAKFLSALVLESVEAPRKSMWGAEGAVSRAVTLAATFGVDGKALEKAARQAVVDAERKATKKSNVRATTKKAAKRR
jgi:ParB/RepB/Spo0J family partition protein